MTFDHPESFDLSTDEPRDKYVPLSNTLLKAIYDYCIKHRLPKPEVK